jgi:ParB family chromosome partitioning protein
MRAPWSKTTPQPAKGFLTLEDLDPPGLFRGPVVTSGATLMVTIDRLDEDQANPRTEFPVHELEELAADISERGILQPLLVERVGPVDRYLVRFGAKRLRAARLAGLAEVPVTVSGRARDAYDQVAENLKRHARSPLDMARFIRGRIDAGESNAAIAKRLAIDQTTVAHHLSLLSLPPMLEEALTSGRCTSPRTLHELSKLHDEHPERVAELAINGRPITRQAVAAVKDATSVPAGVGPAQRSASSRADPPSRRLQRALALCEQLDVAIARLLKAGATQVAPEELAAFRRRVAELASRLG